MSFISLDHAILIGKGSSRRCYQHPEDENLCIKVEKNPRLGITAEEVRFYRKLQKRGISWEMVARFHGMVETDKGAGAVFDMPRDSGGTVSRTLDRYFMGDEALQVETAVLAAALIELKAYLLREHVVLRELKPENLVFRRSADGSGGRFILIDGIGSNQFLPLAWYLKPYGRRVLMRKWSKFVGDLEALAVENSFVAELLNSYRGA